MLQFYSSTGQDSLVHSSFFISGCSQLCALYCPTLETEKEDKVCFVTLRN